MYRRYFSIELCRYIARYITLGTEACLDFGISERNVECLLLEVAYHVLKSIEFLRRFPPTFSCACQMLFEGMPYEDRKFLNGARN